LANNFVVYRVDCADGDVVLMLMLMISLMAEGKTIETHFPFSRIFAFSMIKFTVKGCDEPPKFVALTPPTAVYLSGTLVRSVLRENTFTNIFN
jgi:hypothetical protein